MCFTAFIRNLCCTLIVVNSRCSPINGSGNPPWGQWEFYSYRPLDCAVEVWKTRKKKKKVVPEISQNLEPAQIDDNTDTGQCSGPSVAPQNTKTYNKNHNA